jgi:PAS domain S-box-containing protein
VNPESARRPLSIAAKLRLAFGGLLTLIVLIMAAWLFSLHLANQARKTILASAAIERTVLNMDRLLEKARRLHGDFFLQYNRIGLAEAHVQFAQPSVRLIAEAVAASAELKKLIAQSDVGKALRRHDVDLNLYLASAKRFADTSLESIDVVTRLAAPEGGLEAQFSGLLADLTAATAPFAPLKSLGMETRDHYQEYRLSRQRPAMQSAFNTLTSLRGMLGNGPPPAHIPAATAKKIEELTTRLESTGEEILAADLAVKNKFRDFTLQTNTVQPIAQALINQAGNEVRNAQDKIVRSLQAAVLLLAIFVLAAVGGGLLVSRFISRAITDRIAALTDCASQTDAGRIAATAAESPADELGRLGRTFNLMSGRIRELVDDLERKIEQRTMQLGESEQRFRCIANELPNVGIIGFDRDRRIFFWNRACERLYGRTGAEATGQCVEDLTTNDAERAGLREQLRQGIERDNAFPGGEARFRSGTGGEVAVFVSYFTVTSPQGRQELYSLHIDLTELKQAQEESALRESLYRSLFDHTSSGVGVLRAVDDGRDFIVSDLNPAAERIEGRSRQQLLGQSLLAQFPGVAPTGLLAQMRKVWLTGEPITLPPLLYQHQERHRWRQGHLYKIPTGEVVFVYDDITQLKDSELSQASMEAQLQRARKMEAIGLLAGGVAHDLNNILSGIVSYPDLMLMQLPPDSKLRKPVLAIQESGQRAAAVVADLLTVARGVSSERRICSLNRLAGEYLASPEHEALLARHPGVAVITEFAADIRPLSCSPVHIKKSLMNLITNAAEAIAHSGRVIVRTRNEELEPEAARQLGVEPGRHVVLEIADSGSGIAQADIEHIFEPFYTKKVMGRSGTGLGLAVVWNTVQDHQGGVAAASSEQGSVFTLRFPAAAPETRLTAEPGAEETPPMGCGESILIVDDEPLQRDIAGQMLESLGYQVFAVASGEEAVERLQEHPADLVLLDMLMGAGINGRETYEQIIRRRPGQKALLVSGFSESEEVRAALRLGVSGYLQKPYALKTLARAVAVLLAPKN